MTFSQRQPSRLLQRPKFLHCQSVVFTALARGAMTTITLTTVVFILLILI